MNKTQILKVVAAAVMAVAATFGCTVKAQVWLDEDFEPCPDVKIIQKQGHTPHPAYAARGWDTVVACPPKSTIMVSAEPYIPAQYFNGTYKVTTITYNPPAPDFRPGTRFNFTSSDDDKFYPTATPLPGASGNTPAFVFYFFGKRKTSFVAGSNGIITFNNNAAGQGCPYSLNAGDTLPWPTGSSYTSNQYLHDAIFGVYEDIHPIPGEGASNNNLPRGVYQGVIGEYPCRKIIFSVNDITQYMNTSCPNNRCTYQMVCYEGSNIIELHIKHRAKSAHNLESGGWNQQRGIIGILNEDGNPQVRGSAGQPNCMVVNGSPAWFTPIHRGTPVQRKIVDTIDGVPTPRWETQIESPDAESRITEELDSIAFRYIPMGTPQTSLRWYRIFDDGRDSVPLTQNPNDPVGYYEPMHYNPSSPGYDPQHPTLTKAYLHPTEPSKFVVELFFKDAEQHPYTRRDTIFIGVDTSNELTLKSITPQPEGTHTINICNGQQTALQIETPLTMADTRWRVDRVLNGKRIQMPETMYELGNNNTTIALKPDPAFDTLPANHIDSLRVSVSVDFISGCMNFDTFIVRVFPNFDTVNEAGICEGQTYHWDADGNDYTDNTTQPVAHLHSGPGCDSTVHLNLTVYGVSHTIEHREDCRAFTWRNGRTYTESNYATAWEDTVKLANRYGCDSIVQLELVIYPLTARIESDVEEFTYDNMNAVLSDVSTGAIARQWLLPTVDVNGDSTTAKSGSAMVYYTISDSLDGANIWLIAASRYGCRDTAYLYLPFNKETMWVPTAFMPEDPSGNNLFHSVSMHTEQQEMWVYDRMGRVVGHCKGVDCGWDGRDMDGNMCPQGAYVYIINYTTEYHPKQTVRKHGSVTLIR